MSDAARRLSLLRRDLHRWRDALSGLRDKPDIHPKDVVAGIEKILSQDSARIGLKGGYTSETPIDVTEFGANRPTRGRMFEAGPSDVMLPTTDVVWADEP